LITGVSFSQDKLQLNEGEALVFSSPGDSGQLIKRNYIGIDLFETLIGYKSMGRLHLSYERLSKTGETGFAAEILLSKPKNNNEYTYPSVWYGNWFYTGGMNSSYMPFNSFIKAGINHYPFNYSLNHVNTFRFLWGISLLAGDVNREEYFGYHIEKNNVFVAFLISNLDIKLYLSRSVQFKAGIDMSLLPFLVFVAPELGFNISF